MACINMFNPEQSLTMSPRISFSNDFVLDPQPPQPTPPSAPQISDRNFEFSVGSRLMMAADELFFKGKMLPLRSEDRNNHNKVTTLRDELRVVGENEGGRPPKGSSIRWKGFLGLKKGTGKKDGSTGKEQCSDGGAGGKDAEIDQRY